jgi:hypothetical protein
MITADSGKQKHAGRLYSCALSASRWQTGTHRPSSLSSFHQLPFSDILSGSRHFEGTTILLQDGISRTTKWHHIPEGLNFSSTAVRTYNIAKNEIRAFIEIGDPWSLWNEGSVTQLVSRTIWEWNYFLGLYQYVHISATKKGRVMSHIIRTNGVLNVSMDTGCVSQRVCVQMEELW